MIKEGLISLVRNRLQKYDKTAIYHDKVIEYQLDVCWNEILHDAFNSDETNYDFYAKDYYGVSVTLVNGRYQALYPDPIVQLISKSEGVRRVSVSDFDLEFVPVSLYEQELLEGLELDQMFDGDGVIRYRVMYDKIQFLEDMSGVSTVDMTLVIPFRAYDMTEDIPIPSGKAMSLVDLAVERLSTIPPVDLTNANN